MKFDIIDILLITIIGMLVGILGFMIVNEPPICPDLSGELQECQERDEAADEIIKELDSIIENQRELIIEMSEDCGKLPLI